MPSQIFLIQNKTFVESIIPLQDELMRRKMSGFNLMTMKNIDSLLNHVGKLPSRDSIFMQEFALNQRSILTNLYDDDYAARFAEAGKLLESKIKIHHFIQEIYSSRPDVL
jgi:hypothetical protein